jgi:hypothetical protein
MGRCEDFHDFPRIESADVAVIAMTRAPMRGSF